MYYRLGDSFVSTLAQEEQRQLDQQQVQLQKKQQQAQQQHQHQLQAQQQIQQHQDHSKKSGKNASPALLEKLQIKQENTGIQLLYYLYLEIYICSTYFYHAALFCVSFSHCCALTSRRVFRHATLKYTQQKPA